MTTSILLMSVYDEELNLITVLHVKGEVEIATLAQGKLTIKEVFS